MLEPPTSGEVIVNGKNMMKLSGKELRDARKDIGMIFQHFNLLSNRTVYQLSLIHILLQAYQKE